MKTLHINVANKVATYSRRDGDIVCGNSDYQVKFTFDSEWEAHSEKTARFIWGGAHHDVDFTGDTCNVPKISNAHEVQIGVYAGDLSTTTPAVVGCLRSILCGNEPQRPESAEVYTNEAKAAADRAEAAAEEARSIIPTEAVAKAEAAAVRAEEAANNAATEAAEAAAQAVAEPAAQAAAQAAEDKIAEMIEEYGIVQTTGGSATSVMSQKAVTDIVNKSVNPLSCVQGVGDSGGVATFTFDFTNKLIKYNGKGMFLYKNNTARVLIRDYWKDIDITGIAAYNALVFDASNNTFKLLGWGNFNPNIYPLVFFSYESSNNKLYAVTSNFPVVDENGNVLCQGYTPVTQRKHINPLDCIFPCGNENGVATFIFNKTTKQITKNSMSIGFYQNGAKAITIHDKWTDIDYSGAGYVDALIYDAQYQKFMLLNGRQMNEDRYPVVFFYYNGNVYSVVSNFRVEDENGNVLCQGSQPSASGKWGAGKTFVNIGDSIFGNFDEYSISYYISSASGATSHNCGFGGTRAVARATGNTYGANFAPFDFSNLANAICTGDWSTQEAQIGGTYTPEVYAARLATIKAIDFSKVDVLTVAYGTNDWAAGENDTDAIAAALETGIKLINRTYPKMKILLITPIWRLDSLSDATTDSDTKDFGSGTLEQFASRYETLAKKVKVPFLDSYHNLTLNADNGSVFYGDSTAYVHLNAAGRKMFAELIDGKLKTLY